MAKWGWESEPREKYSDYVTTTTRCSQCGHYHTKGFCDLQGLVRLMGCQCPEIAAPPSEEEND